MRNFAWIKLWAMTGAVSLFAIEPPSIAWLGTASDNAWSTPGNWSGGQVPDSSAVWVDFFPNHELRSHQTVLLDVGRTVNHLYFEGNFRVTGLSGSTLTLHQGIEVASDYFYHAFFDEGSYGGYDHYDATVKIEQSLTLNLAGATTFYTNYGTLLDVNAPLSGTHQLTITGEGRTILRGNSPDFSGGILLNNGHLGIQGSRALGTGTLTIAPSSYGGSTLYGLGTGTEDDVEIDNNLILHDHLRIGRSHADRYHTDLVFSGTVTLLDQLTIELDDSAVFFTGTINEDAPSTKITIADSTGVAVFSGTSNFTGGLHAEKGGAIFMASGALPASGYFSTGTHGYIGLGDPLADMADYIGRFDPAQSAGAIGFDTHPDLFSTPHTYTGAIDLTGFDSNVRLGSVSSARLTGTITPASGDYRFGTGGGILHVASELGGERGVTVNSPASSPLMVVLESSENWFLADATVSHSGVRFLPGALPAGTNFVLQTSDAYVGTHDSASPNDFIARFPTTLTSGIIGFDGGIDVTGLDLSPFTATTPRIYLGTSTTASISGPITLANGMHYLFTGYRGGQLTVNSVLDGSVPVHIGHPSVLGDRHDDTFSGVRLNAANTFTGNTYLYAGALIPGHDQALGTGKLFVEGAYDSNRAEYLHPRLHIPADASPWRTLANDISLDSDLTIQLDASLRLTGQIDGWGTIQLNGTSSTELELSGHNDAFYGEILLNSGNLVAAHDQALANAILFFSPDSTSSVIFTTSMPEIRGLHTTIPNQPVSVSLSPTSGDPAKLTINTGYLHLSFGGNITGNGSLTIRSGGGDSELGAESFSEGSQSFTGLINLSGGIAVESGARLSLTNETTFGAEAGPITLDGGTLRLDHAYNAVANVSFGSGGGRLEGNGTLNPIGGPGAAVLTFGSNTFLSPGASIGSLELGHNVEFASGGTLEFELAENSAGGLISDSLQLYSLSLTATTESPFNLRIGAPYSLGDFNPHVPQQWEVFSTQLALGTLNINAFNVSWDNFNPYSVNFALAQVGNSLNLTFTPIPEPTTAVLLLFGLGFLAAYRPRRQR